MPAATLRRTPWCSLRSTGNTPRARSQLRDLRAVLKRAKVPRIGFHDLRHCHASHLLMQGVPVKIVQERLGHATPAVTLGIYAHVLPHMQHDAARDLEKRLLGVADRCSE
ncbi:MAG TPA: tyrosine-type recombinase/integrase [bacterium]|nr:tyrosine-type recombinase/integrase [bacterium]